MKNKYNKKNVVVFVFLFIFLFYFGAYFSTQASDSVGTIDSVYKYAKGAGPNSIKINFGLFRGSANVLVTDTNLSGYAWGENIGWINLSPNGGGVLNNGEGKLSGYASSEYGGWIDFIGVVIDSEGDFSGSASSDKLGLIVFNCITNNSCATENFKVKTDWRPIYVRNGTRPSSKVSVPVPVIKPTSPSLDEKNTFDLNQNQNTLTDNSNIFSNSKPLSVTNLDQYEGGGDVIHYNENTGTILGGEITRTLNLSSNEQTIKTEPVAVIKEDNQTLSTPTSTGNISEKAKEITLAVEQKAQEIKNEAKIISQAPTVNVVTKTVTTAGVAGGGTVVISSFLGGVASFSEILLTIFRLWSVVLSAIGLRRRREPWGTVYDSVTKQPLDPVYVTLEDQKGKEIASSITDLDGRYGFLAPPGIYRILVKKTNYIAPSLKLHGKSKDEIYDNLYFGEDIKLDQDKGAIAKNIPMDPQGFDWNEFAKRDQKVMNFHSPRSKIFAQISNAFFYFGVILVLVLLFIKPDIYNIAILSIYLILFILRKINFKHKSFGTIFEDRTGNPLPFAVIRIFKKGDEKERFHRVADQYGHYYCLLPKGEYQITIEKKNIDESYSRVYASDAFFVKNGILNNDFRV